jgi:2-methylisocitrate lyase-like PEP mutase family enzyme
LPMLACRAEALAKAGAQIFFQPACRAGASA